MHRTLTVLYALALILGTFVAAPRAEAAGADPFAVKATVTQTVADLELWIDVQIPEDHFLYADQFRVSIEGARSEALRTPEAHEKQDPFSGELKQVFDQSFSSRYRLSDAQSEVKVQLAYQGCDKEMCFFPQRRSFVFPMAGSTVSLAETGTPAAIATTAGGAEWTNLIRRFSVAGTASGFMKVDPFLAFLGGGAAGAGAGVGDSARGIGMTILLILLGGLALNLTPCVLPLIPINLAILGAGTRASSKGQGLVLGALYGAAIALVYGSLGLAVVLFGAKFGALNASITFNVIIALIFLVMALAMFDVITVDFSRFHSSSGGSAPARGKYVAAFIAGALSALLAGACVAPAVISTLLLAASMYADGVRAAALLPFLLGMGMALPWPLAGAGLSVLPKPGAWMVRVKQAMGLLILVMSGYYAWVGWSVAQARRMDTATQSIQALTKALEGSLRDGRPVFIDFWATWCKNCEAMEVTTFQDPAVRKTFEGLHVVKFQAEQPDVSPAREVLDHFNAVGLPTYILLRPAGP